jgi:hypothetical protein
MQWLVNLVLNWVKNYFIKNWRTTVIGLVGGICTQVPALAPYKDQILAATVALVAVFAKDGGVTGTSQQPALPAPGTPGVPVSSSPGSFGG